MFIKNTYTWFRLTAKMNGQKEQEYWFLFKNDSIEFSVNINYDVYDLFSNYLQRSEKPIYNIYYRKDVPIQKINISFDIENKINLLDFNFKLLSVKTDSVLVNSSINSTKDYIYTSNHRMYPKKLIEEAFDYFNDKNKYNIEYNHK